MDIVNYKGKEYYFVSDICTETGIQRSYIYRLLKQKKLAYLDKEGIKLIEKSGFDDYQKLREAKASDKTELIKALKTADPKKLEEIKKILDI